MALSFPRKGIDLSRWSVGLGVGWLADNLGWDYVFVGVIAVSAIGMGVFLFMWGASRDGYARAQKIGK